MPPLVILADDFAGANDAGLPFAVHGLRTVVLLSADRLPSVEADIVVIDTHSRDCPPDDASRRTAAACKTTLQTGHRVLYKKIDSTLRGHIGQEADAVRAVLGYPAVLVVPAFPELGRITVGGYHLVDGVPVSRTAMRDDPGSPVTTSFLPDLIERQSSCPVGHVELQTVLSGSEAIQRQVDELIWAGAATIVVDAASSDDLDTILAAVDAMQPAPLLCGSAGLARRLAARLAGTETTPAAALPPVQQASGPVLLIAGSVHPVTARQVDEMSRRPRTTVCRIDLAALFMDGDTEREMERVVQEGVAGLSAGQDVMLSLTPPDETDRRAWVDRLRTQAGGDDPVERLAARLGEIGRRVFARERPAGLVVTGGETATHVIRSLEGWGTRIVSEVRPGIARVNLLGGPYDGLPVVIKPGAFGGPDGLVTTVQALRPESAAVIDPAQRPILGITMGDPNGIGPEIIVKTLADPEIYRVCRPLVVGHADVIARHLRFAPSPLRVNPVTAPREAQFRPGTIDVLTVMEADVERLKPGEVSELAGRLAVESVVTATRLAMAGEIGGVVTAPLNKEAMNRAGYHYAGHTELLADLTGTKAYRLTLAFDSILVSHVTTHVSLRQAIERLSEDGIITTVEIIGNALKRTGRPNPRIAVAGLNPHAGEGGMFGDEEIRIITPAIQKAQAAGWQVIGPLPPDTVFMRALRGEFDGIVGMYHDQGHIPVKAIAFDRSVNVSLGLPIVRTSVDHGTAFDIAGQGVANPENLGAAIRMAVKLIGGR
ncbi:MAG: 4-hydroxythreonine-4-phosphate dehydrogenase PdxA [Candidatus Latescibacteria bacterium]|nr:4-hydroxythreonine-4-phosphate dehydrogenase PdxA [Candidatus Latescibacterota bacterium]